MLAGATAFYSCMIDPCNILAQSIYTPSKTHTTELLYLRGGELDLGRGGWWIEAAGDHTMGCTEGHI